MAIGTLESPHMPDLVIDKILRLLPTKPAVQVSFPSNQWQGVVSSFPTLNFDEDDDFGRHNIICYNYGQYQHQLQHKKFIRFLKRYLDFRDKYGQKEPLDKLSLHMRMYSIRDQDIVTKWLIFACQGGLRELDINLIYNKMCVDPEKYRIISDPDQLGSNFLNYLYPLPLVAISSAKSLTSLKLGYVNVPEVRRVGDQHVVERLFPSLKILSFNAAEVATDQVLYSVLRECPSIEHLSLTHCWNIGNWEFYVCCSSLKSLEIKYCMIPNIQVDQAFNLESFTFVSLPKFNCAKMILNSAFNLKYINISVEYIHEFSLLGCHRALEASIECQQIHRFVFFDGYLSAKVSLKAIEGTIDDQAIIDKATMLVGELSDQEWFSSDSTYIPRLVTFLRRFSCCKKINLYIQDYQALTIPIDYRKMASLPPLPKTCTLTVRLPDKKIERISGDKYKFAETLEWIAPSASIWIKLVDFEEDRKKQDQRASYAGNR